MKTEHQHRVRFGLKRFAAGAGLLAAAGILLTGCGEKEEIQYEPEITALELREDGTLTETIIDVLDQSWYSGDELSAMIAEAISDYNAKTGREAVSADEISTGNSQVRAQLTYAGKEDYEDFNQISFYAGSMLGAEMEGYRFDMSFRSVSKGETSAEIIEAAEPLSHKEYQVLVGDASHEYRVPGSVVYVSANAVTVDAYTVRASVTETADSSEQICIIYEFRE